MDQKVQTALKALGYRASLIQERYGYTWQLFQGRCKKPSFELRFLPTDRYRKWQLSEVHGRTAYDHRPVLEHPILNAVRFAR